MEIEVKDSERNIANKLARGTSIAMFFVQCLTAIKMSNRGFKVSEAYLLLLLLLLPIAGLAQSDPPGSASELSESQPPQQQPKHKHRPAKKRQHFAEMRPTNSVSIDAPYSKAQPTSTQGGADSKATGNSGTDADWWMVWLTGGIFLVAGGQAYLFVVQLRLITRSMRDAEKMAESAKVSADAAAATVKVMQDTAVRQLRAYVSLIKGAASINDKHGFDIVLSVKNFGQTPAYGVRYFCDAIVLSVPLQEPFPPVRDPLTERTRVIPPQSGNDIVMRSKHGAAENVDLAAIARGSKCLFVYGYLIYTDTFSVKRTSYFRFIHEDGGFYRCIEGNYED